MTTIVLLLIVSAAPAPSSSQAEAKAAFDRATQHYNLGEMDAALTDYKEAYRKAALPAFLFNIGQCYYALGDYERAAFFYEGFLREAPNDEHRAQVEGFLAESKKLVAEGKSKPHDSAANP